MFVNGMGWGLEIREMELDQFSLLVVSDRKPTETVSSEIENILSKHRKAKVTGTGYNVNQDYTLLPEPCVQPSSSKYVFK